MSEEDNEFSVCVFFPDDDYSYVCRFVSAWEAARTFAAYALNNPAAKIGIIVRAIITDGGDCIVTEWRHGRGITYPPPVSNN